MNTKKMLQSLSAAAGSAFFLLLVFMPVFFFLMSQGWQHPIRSLQAKAEMQFYLDDAYAGQELQIGFPFYNMVGDEFISYIKDDEGRVVFGLSYTAYSGIAEYNAVLAEDGHYCLSVPLCGYAGVYTKSI